MPGEQETTSPQYEPLIHLGWLEACGVSSRRVPNESRAEIPSFCCQGKLTVCLGNSQATDRFGHVGEGGWLVAKRHFMVLFAEIMYAL